MIIYTSDNKKGLKTRCNVSQRVLREQVEYKTAICGEQIAVFDS